MPNFDPGQALPDALEPTVITQPMSLPSASGGVILPSGPSDPDPAQTAAARYAAANAQAQFQLGISGAGSVGGLPSGIPAPAPPGDDHTIVVTPGVAGPPQVSVVAKPPGPPSARPVGGAGPPGADLTALMAGATSPADPNGDAVDQALAADATARAAPPPGTAKAPDALAAGGAAADAAAKAHEAAVAAQGDQEVANATAEAAARDKLAKETEQKAAIQKVARDEAAAHIQQARDKAAKEPYHSFWETKTAGQEALAGIGILLGSASFSAGHVNQAVGIIDRAIKQDFDVQQAKHAQLWKDVESTIEQGQALRSDQLDDMANFRTRQAQTLDAVIAKGTALAAQSKNKAGVAALADKNAQLAFERDKAYDEAARLKQSAGETMRHNKAEESIGRAKVGIEAAKERRAGTADQEDKVYKLAAKAFPSYKDAQKAVKESNDVHEAIDRLKTNPSSLTSALELGGIVKLIEGRNSIAGLKMAKDAAGNVSSGFLDELSKALTGNQGASRRQTLINELETIASSKDKATAGYRKQAETATSRLRKHAPEAVDSYVSGIFGEPRAASAPAAPALRPDQITRLRAVPKTDPQYAKAQQLLQGL